MCVYLAWLDKRHPCLLINVATMQRSRFKTVYSEIIAHNDNIIMIDMPSTTWHAMFWQQTVDLLLHGHTMGSFLKFHDSIQHKDLYFQYKGDVWCSQTCGSDRNTFTHPSYHTIHACYLLWPYCVRILCICLLWLWHWNYFVKLKH